MEMPSTSLPPFLLGWGAARHSNAYRIFCGCHHVLARVYGPPEETDKMFRKEIEQAVEIMQKAPTSGR